MTAQTTWMSPKPALFLVSVALVCFHLDRNLLYNYNFVPPDICAVAEKLRKRRCRHVTPKALFLDGKICASHCRKKKTDASSLRRLKPYPKARLNPANRTTSFWGVSKAGRKERGEGRELAGRWHHEDREGRGESGFRRGEGGFPPRCARDE